MKLPMPPRAGKDTIFEPVPPPNAVLTTSHPDQVAKASSHVPSLPDEVNSSEISTGLSRKFTKFDVSAKPTAQVLNGYIDSELVESTSNTSSLLLPSKKLKCAKDCNTMLRLSLRRRTQTFAASADIKVSHEIDIEFALSDDPVTFSEAAKNCCWRQSMKQEK
jgi:hypothetical protein